MEQTQQFLNYLQSCIAPVALISGIGLLLLTLTNRLGRTIDRTRNLVTDLDNNATKKRNQKETEIRILYRRSNLLKNSIGSIVISIMSSSLIIPVLFFMIFFNYHIKVLGYLFFVVSIVFILISNIYFFLDILISLKALKIEAQEFLT